MTIVRRAASLGVCLAAVAGCRGSGNELKAVMQSPTAVAREARLKKSLADHDAEAADKPLAQWVMPAPLREISGLALTKDDHLLTHGDEIGEIWEIDYRRGILVKHFFLGDRGAKGDFEGITIGNGVVFLLDSKGKIFAFKEGDDGAHVKYNVVETGLKQACEFESIVYDPRINSLLLACKHIHDKTIHDSIVIYKWSLSSDSTAERLTKLVVPVGDALQANHWKTLHPSDITIDPLSGNYVMVASLEKALVEVTPAGELVFARPLPEGHAQAEGVAITKDSILIVSDEAKQGPGIITLYKWP